MAKEYPVIAVIGTEECKKEMEQIQEKLTKQRHIVVPIGMCGKEDLDMRLDKIDLAEELFVVNPAGKIEMNIWTDICYAYLTGKDISSLESMSYREIQEKANDLIYGSEMLAQRQLEMVQHNSYLDKDVADSVFLCHGYFRLSIDTVKRNLIFFEFSQEQFSFIIRTKSDIQAFQVVIYLDTQCLSRNDLPVLIFRVAVYNVEISVNLV